MSRLSGRLGGGAGQEGGGGSGPEGDAGESRGESARGSALAIRGGGRGAVLEGGVCLGLQTHGQMTPYCGCVIGK